MIKALRKNIWPAILIACAPEVLRASGEQSALAVL
jgi:hypothetical protein